MEVKAPPFRAMSVGVPKLEEAVSKIKRLGGNTHTEVITIPNVGRMQMMMDPQGAAFSSVSREHREAPRDRAGNGRGLVARAGDDRLAAAMKFYEQAFGWQPTQAMDMGPMGRYQMFNRPHGMIGGMMNKPPEMANVPPNWQIYFRVSDVHAAAEPSRPTVVRSSTARWRFQAGTKVVNAMDPQGAAFGLHAKKASQALAAAPARRPFPRPRLSRPTAPEALVEGW